MFTYNHLSRSARRDQARQRIMDLQVPEFRPFVQQEDATSPVRIPVPTDAIVFVDGPDLRIRITQKALYSGLEKPKQTKRPQPPAEVYLGVLHAPTLFPRKRNPVQTPAVRVVGFEVSDGSSTGSPCLSRSSYSSDTSSDAEV